MGACIDRNYVIKNRDFSTVLSSRLPELLWREIDLKCKIKDIRDGSGVYVCYIEDKTTGFSDAYYVGSTKSIRNRMATHLHIKHVCKNFDFKVTVKFAECKNRVGYEMELHHWLMPIIDDRLNKRKVKLLLSGENIYSEKFYIV